MKGYTSWGTERTFFKKGTSVGIDLGTTNSAVSFWKEGFNYVKVIKNPRLNSKVTPSTVHINKNDRTKISVGLPEESDGEMIKISCVKRLIGRKFDDHAVQNEMKYLNYTVSPTSKQDRDAVVEVSTTQGTFSYTPEKLSSLILKQLKEYAEEKLRSEVRNAVITVPAYFNDRQRKSTIAAAELAGFKAIRLLNEPTSAAMAYGLFISGQKHALVFDLGGGTFDVSLLFIDNGKFEVLGIGGDTHLGGEDVNHLIYEHVIQRLKTHHKLSLSSLSKLDQSKILDEIERCKKQLSRSSEARIRMSKIGNVKDFEYKLTRKTLELVCKDLFDKCIEITKSVIEEAGLTTNDVDEVVLVGGSTRIPKLRKDLSNMFDGKELCRSIDSDLAVAQGAGIQAAILSGIDKAILQDVLMMDVLPLSIGLEKHNGEMEVILPRNSKLPVSVTKCFETFEDNQRGITVEVYEGENPIARENTKISYFNFMLPKNKIGKAGENEHPVTFTMNENGVLQVEAGIFHTSNVSSEEDEESKKQIYLLVSYLVVLAIAYVFARVYFSDFRDEYDFSSNQ